ncbi:MAG: hypothetical protein ACJZ48_01490 [Candidatus Pelagibacterales bacterium]
MSCYGDTSIEAQIAFLMTWPILAIAISPLLGLLLALLFQHTTMRELWATGRQRGERGLVDAVLLRYAMPLSLLVLFFAFPPVTALAFRMFEPCTTFSDEVGEAQKWLVSYRKHYAVACPSDELSDAQSIAWVAILLYPVGVIVLSAWLLYLGRTTLLLEDEHTAYTRSIAFLHAPFVPSYFYFDLLELSKKLLLIGFASLIEPGSLVQIMIAVVVSLLFLVLHLQSSPYKRRNDNLLATMINLSLVVFFFWCTLLQLEALGDVESGELDATGVAVSVMMLISIIGALVIAAVLFVSETAAKAATEMAESRKRKKWAGCTIEPPTTKWPADRGYACFLSHYKMEAASDARLLHDMLAKMLRYPVFLDSAKLTDLRHLISDGVADSDVMLVLATKGFVKRPWCLLEVVHAARLRVPIIVVEVKNGGFDAAEAQQYVEDLEETLGADDPEALELLHEYLGPDLTELKTACANAFGVVGKGGNLGSRVWNPNASDSELIACLKDICETMATAKGGSLAWAGDEAAERDSLRRSTRGDGGSGDAPIKRQGTMVGGFVLKRRKPTDDAPALHLVCCTDEALNDARVLQTELAMALDRFVSISVPKPDDAPSAPSLAAARSAEAVAVLLTKGVLHEPAALLEIYAAAAQGKTIVPICLQGRGYDFKEAGEHLHQLATRLGQPKLAQLQHGLEATTTTDDERGASVDALRATLAATLPRIIAVNWEPEGGKHQLDAAVTNVLGRLKTQSGPSLKRTASAKAAASPRAARAAAQGLSHAQVAPKPAQADASDDRRQPDEPRASAAATAAYPVAAEYTPVAPGSGGAVSFDIE